MDRVGRADQDTCKKRSHRASSFSLSDLDLECACDPEQFIYEADFFKFPEDSSSQNVTDAMTTVKKQPVRPHLSSFDNELVELRNDISNPMKDSNDQFPECNGVMSSQKQQRRATLEKAVERRFENGPLPSPKTVERTAALDRAITQSKRTHDALLEWDSRMGIKKSFSRKMSNTSSSRSLVKSSLQEIYKQI